VRFRACIALLLYVSACATSAPSPREPAARDPRLANLQRATTLPWTDGGRCAVQAASEPWPVLAERCFYALDHDRIEFHDPIGRCAVASAGAAAMGLGVCVLAAPEIVVGAVVVAGVVVVGFAIKEALDAYKLRWGDPEKVRPAPETKPVPETESFTSLFNENTKKQEDAKTGPRITEVTEAEGVIEIVAEGENGEIRIMGNIETNEGTITLDQTHIRGQGAGTSGLREMGEIIREFGRSRGASEVIIQGATRTTGARPGHTPRPIRVRVK
jgi:hypothetical protein